MVYYLITALATLLLAANFSLGKDYQRKVGDSISCSLPRMIIGSVFSTFIILAINGFRIKVTPFSCLMALASMIPCTLYSIISFKIYKKGGMTFFTLFLMAGGMTLPYIFGLCFLDEEFSFLRLVGLILILAAVIISNITKGKKDFSLIILCVLVFFLNGFVSIFLKLHQISSYDTVSTKEFMLLQNLIQLPLNIMIYLIFGRNNKNPNTEKFNIKFVVISAFLSVIVSNISSYLQLIGASQLPASVLYPMITGGTVIFSSLAGILIFKDKVPKRVIVSILLCFAGTLMFL